MKKVLFYLLLVHSLHFRGQQWNWAKELGLLYGSEHPALIKTNKSEDLFIVTTKQYGPLDFYSKVERRQGNGEVLWSKFIGQYNNQANFITDIALDRFDNIYLLGFVGTHLHFADTTIYTADNNWELFIARMDQNGNEKWIKHYPLIHEWQEGAAITIDHAGDLILALGADAYPYDGPLQIFKILKDGTTIWSKSFSGPNSFRKLFIDSENNIYLSGNFTGGFKIDGVNYYPDNNKPYYYKTFLLKLKSSGEFESVEIFPGALVNDLGIDSHNNIYLQGSYNSTMKIRQLGLTLDTCYPYHCSGYFLAKLNPSGSSSWVHQLPLALWPGKRGSIAVTNSGQFYFYGTQMDSITFDNVILPKDTAGGAQIFIVRFDRDGLAQFGIKNSGNATVWAGDIVQNEHQIVYISGDYLNNDFYSPSFCLFGDSSLPLTGFNEHIFIAKLIDDHVLTDLVNADISEYLSISPNPNSGKFNITFNKYRPKNKIKLTIKNVLGQIIYLSYIIEPAKTEEIIIGSENSGMYLVEIEMENQKIIKKIIVN